jgi:hypothetical protein
MHKIAAKVGDVFEEQNRMSKCDTVKQNQVLMNLAHITDMWYYGQPVFPCQQAHGNKL